MHIKPDINPVKLRTLRGDHLFLALRFPNLEQSPFGALSALSHSGQLRALIHDL